MTPQQLMDNAQQQLGISIDYTFHQLVKPSDLDDHEYLFRLLDNKYSITKFAKDSYYSDIKRSYDLTDLLLAIIHNHPELYKTSNPELFI